MKFKIEYIKVSNFLKALLCLLWVFADEGSIGMLYTSIFLTFIVVLFRYYTVDLEEELNNIELLQYNIKYVRLSYLIFGLYCLWHVTYMIDDYLVLESRIIAYCIILCFLLDCKIKIRAKEKGDLPQK
jgi:hypothetical protein